MQHKKRNIGTLLAAVFAVSVLAVGGVSAEQLGGGTTTPDGTPKVKTETRPTTTESGKRTLPTVKTEVKTEHATETGAGTETEVHTSGNVDQLRLRAKQALETERSEKKTERTAEQRQKACSAREDHLNDKIANFSNRAQRHLDAYNKTFDRLQAFQASKQLSVADYDALVAAANTQKATATAAVSALTAVSVKVDCTATDPAAEVVTVKTAVASARQALQDYRASVKNLLTALMAAKSAADTTSDTNNSGSTEGTN